MAKMVSMIGVDPRELQWLKMLLLLLRHPDPTIAEMVRQALLYVAKNAGREAEPITPAEERSSY